MLPAGGASRAKFQKTSAKRRAGGEVVEELSEKPVGSQKLPQNVSGALTAMQRNKMDDDPTVYLVKVADYNPNMPANLWLLCGDYNLEAMDASFQAGFDGVNKGLSNPFVDTALLLTNFLDACAKKMGSPTAAFIDCPPLLTGGTKVALAASRSLIVPVSYFEISATLASLKMMLRASSTTASPLATPTRSMRRSSRARLPPSRRSTSGNSNRTPSCVPLFTIGRLRF